MMKNKKLLALLLTMVLAMTTGLLGCSKEKKVTADSEQYLNLLLYEQRTLDQNDAEDMSSAVIISETMEGLVRYENTGSGDEVKPAGAKDWKISDDGLVYTFTLRDHKWTDGQPVTAQQYVDSWVRLLDSTKGFGYAYFAYDVKNAKKYNAGECKAEELGVKALDDKTFEVTLERPTPYFLKKVGFKNLFPIRMDIVNAQGEKYGTDFKTMVWNGPYKMTEYIPDNKVVLEKNDTYWDAEHVKMKKITMQKIEEVSTRMQMFESKQLDITGASRDYLKSFIEKSNKGEFKHMTGVYPESDYFGFNVKNGGPSGLFTSKKVRQAFGLIMDREDITKNLYQRYIAAYGWVPPKLSIGDKEYRNEVPEQMKELMKKYDSVDKIAALYKEGLTEIGKDPNGSYEVEYLTAGTSSTAKMYQEYYQNTFQKLPGVKVKLTVAADTNQYWNLFEELEYDFTDLGWIGDYDDPMTFLDMWVTGGGNNNFKYSSAEYDKLMNEDILKETETPKRLEIFKKAEDILLDDMPITPLIYWDIHRFVQNYVRDAQYPMFGPEIEMKYVYTEGRQ